MEIERKAITSMVADGVAGGVGRLLCYIGIMMLLFGLAAKAVGYPEKDDTDPIDGRSGLKIYTDNLTGCQYLGAGSNGLTPRLDSSGKPICRT